MTVERLVRLLRGNTETASMNPNKFCRMRLASGK